jgi:hypothetical protein
MPVVRKAVREHWARSFSLVHSFENNQGSYDTVRTPDTARGRTWVIQYKLHSSAGASTTYISLHRLTFAILRSYAEQFKVRTELILLRKHIDFYVTTSKLGNLAAITNILQQDSRARFPLFGIILERYQSVNTLKFSACCERLKSTKCIMQVGYHPIWLLLFGLILLASTANPLFKRESDSCKSCHRRWLMGCEKVAIIAVPLSSKSSGLWGSADQR